MLTCELKLDKDYALWYLVVTLDSQSPIELEITPDEATQFLSAGFTMQS